MADIFDEVELPKSEAKGDIFDQVATMPKPDIFDGLQMQTPTLAPEPPKNQFDLNAVMNVVGQQPIVQELGQAVQNPMQGLDRAAASIPLAIGQLDDMAGGLSNFVTDNLSTAAEEAVGPEIFNAKEFQGRVHARTNTADTMKQLMPSANSAIAGLGATAATMAIPIGGGAKAGANIGEAALHGAAQMGLMGAVQNLGEQYGQTGKVDVPQLAASTGLGAVLGGAGSAAVSKLGGDAAKRQALGALLAKKNSPKRIEELHLQQLARTKQAALDNYHAANDIEIAADKARREAQVIGAVHEAEKFKKEQAIQAELARAAERDRSWREAEGMADNHARAPKQPESAPPTVREKAVDLRHTPGSVVPARPVNKLEHGHFKATLDAKSKLDMATHHYEQAFDHLISHLEAHGYTTEGAKIKAPDVVPPEIGEKIRKEAAELAGITDPLREIKSSEPNLIRDENMSDKFPDYEMKGKMSLDKTVEVKHLKQLVNKFQKEYETARDAARIQSVLKPGEVVEVNHNGHTYRIENRTQVKYEPPKSASAKQKVEYNAGVSDGYKKEAEKINDELKPSIKGLAEALSKTHPDLSRILKAQKPVIDDPRIIEAADKLGIKNELYSLIKGFIEDESGSATPLFGVTDDIIKVSKTLSVSAKDFGHEAWRAQKWMRGGIDNLVDAATAKVHLLQLMRHLDEVATGLHMNLWNIAKGRFNSPKATVKWGDQAIEKARDVQVLAKQALELSAKSERGSGLTPQDAIWLERHASDLPATEEGETLLENVRKHIEILSKKAEAFISDESGSAPTGLIADVLSAAPLRLFDAAKKSAKFARRLGLAPELTQRIAMNEFTHDIYKRAANPVFVADYEKQLGELALATQGVELPRDPNALEAWFTLKKPQDILDNKFLTANQKAALIQVNEVKKKTAAILKQEIADLYEKAEEAGEQVNPFTGYGAQIRAMKHDLDHNWERKHADNLKMVNTVVNFIAHNTVQSVQLGNVGLHFIHAVEGHVAFQSSSPWGFAQAMKLYATRDKEALSFAHSFQMKMPQWGMREDAMNPITSTYAKAQNKLLKYIPGSGSKAARTASDVISGRGMEQQKMVIGLLTASHAAAKEMNYPGGAKGLRQAILNKTITDKDKLEAATHMMKFMGRTIGAGPAGYTHMNAIDRAAQEVGGIARIMAPFTRSIQTQSAFFNRELVDGANALGKGDLPKAASHFSTVLHGAAITAMWGGAAALPLSIRDAIGEHDPKKLEQLEETLDKCAILGDALGIRSTHTRPEPLWLMRTGQNLISGLVENAKTIGSIKDANPANMSNKQRHAVVMMGSVLTGINNIADTLSFEVLTKIYGHYDEASKLGGNTKWVYTDAGPFGLSKGKYVASRLYEESPVTAGVRAALHFGEDKDKADFERRAMRNHLAEVAFKNTFGEEPYKLINKEMYKPMFETSEFLRGAPKQAEKLGIDVAPDKLNEVKRKQLDQRKAEEEAKIDIGGKQVKADSFWVEVFNYMQENPEKAAALQDMLKPSTPTNSGPSSPIAQN